ncbi:hypothetical protein [Fluviicola taffensis]|nr:hypothetical protein [Fluviicola taffensis]
MKRSKNNCLIVFISILSFVLHSCSNTENENSNSMVSESVMDTTFYSSGKIMVLTQLKANGQKHGFKRRYFENGNIEYSRTYFKDKLVGSDYWYYKSGGLNMYSVRNIEDSVFFFLYLDSLGNVTEKIGALINKEYEIEGGNDTLQLNKTYLLRFLYADPKIYKFNLDSVILETNKSKRHFKNYYFEKEKAEIIFEFKPKQRCKQKLTLYSSLKDKKGNIKYSNSLDIMLYVK